MLEPPGQGENRVLRPDKPLSNALLDGLGPADHQLAQLVAPAWIVRVLLVEQPGERAYLVADRFIPEAEAPQLLGDGAEAGMAHPPISGIINFCQFRPNCHCSLSTRLMMTTMSPRVSTPYATCRAGFSTWAIG
jgi:hypothetical protein